MNEHVNDTVARLASNSHTIEELRVENDQLRQKLRHQLRAKMYRVDVDNRWANDLFIHLSKHFVANDEASNRQCKVQQQREMGDFS